MNSDAGQMAEQVITAWAGISALEAPPSGILQVNRKVGAEVPLGQILNPESLRCVRLSVTVCEC